MARYLRILKLTVSGMRMSVQPRLVKNVIGKNFSITCSPIKIKTDTFQEITAEITIENKTDYKMTLQGHFEQHAVLRPMPYCIECEMAAHSKKVVKLEVRGGDGVAVDGLGALRFKRVVYCRPDLRPEIAYRDVLEIKVGG